MIGMRWVPQTRTQEMACDKVVQDADGMAHVEADADK